MKMQDDDLPLYLYRFDGQGKHGGKEILETMNECERAISRATKLKETITITDTGDDCVFRCEQGRIVWPRLDSLFPPYHYIDRMDPGPNDGNVS